MRTKREGSDQKRGGKEITWDYEKKSEEVRQVGGRRII
jgi:hypothetical protein